ncbi:hypothetical protein ACVW0J_001411 [Bradyrhizobium sp. i1.7.7]
MILSTSLRSNSCAACAPDREPGLAGAGGADAEHQLVALQRADVGILRGSACAHRALAQIDAVEGGFGRFGVEFEQRALCDHGADRAFDFALVEILPLHGLRVECLQHAARGVAAVARAADGDVVALGVDHDAEPPLDLGEMLAVGADQRGCGAVVVEVDDDLGLGRNLHVAVKFAAGSERRRIRCAFWQGFRLQWLAIKRARARYAASRAHRGNYSVRGCRSGPAGFVR